MANPNRRQDTVDFNGIDVNVDFVCDQIQVYFPRSFTSSELKSAAKMFGFYDHYERTATILVDILWQRGDPITDNMARLMTRLDARRDIQLEYPQLTRELRHRGFEGKAFIRGNDVGDVGVCYQIQF